MSENEGEFKKIICGFLERSIRDTPTAKKLMVDVVAEVFDEARKEFPCYNADEGCDLICQGCTSLQKWFQKWFGE